jgi:hypothetical protein
MPKPPLKPLPLPPVPAPAANPLEIGTLLDTAGAARLLGVSRGLLQQWRLRNQGPPYLRLENETIRYHVADLQVYAASAKVTPITPRPRAFVNTDKIKIETKHMDRQMKRRKYMREYMRDLATKKKLAKELEEKK